MKNIIILHKSEQSFQIEILPLLFKNKYGEEKWLSLFELRVSFLKELRYVSLQILFCINIDIRFYI